MRNALKYFRALLCALLLAGCSDDGPGYFTEIHILPTIDRVDNRMIGNSFQVGDEIGVFVVPYISDNSTAGTIGTDDYASNVGYIYREGSWSLTDGGSLIWPGRKTIDVYGYFPYDASLTTADPRAYNFTIRTDQSTQEGYNASDFLWARTLGLTPISNVPLTFYHRLSKVNINLIYTPPVRADEGNVVSASLIGVVPESVIDLSDGAASARTGGTAASITTLRLEVPESGFDRSFTAVVPPQDIATGTTLIRIEANGGNYVYTTDRDLAFQTGKSLTFNMTITELGMVVEVYEVDDWQSGGVIGGTVEDPAPRVVDLAAIDWTQSYVHYIYDNNILIGQACREYLFLSGTVDVPAVVVYPLGTDGKMDLTKGYVARVYNRARNSSTNVYELNTGSVHGGTVVFSTAGNSMSGYNGGGLPLVNKLRMTSAADIAAAADNAVPVLTTRPYRLTDVDENTYPVVKIGTQYWIRENFKSEHYADGTPLSVYYFNNSPDPYKDLLGGLYIWYTVVDAAGIAPAGWHVPADDEWVSLYQYLTPDAARKLKATYMWNNLSYGDNVTGFEALPGGRRESGGAFNELNTYGQWWSSTSNTTSNAWRVYFAAGSNAITRADLGKGYTQSVRVLRNN